MTRNSTESGGEVPADGLRTLRQLALPDARMRFFLSPSGTGSITQEERADLIAVYELHEAVPKDIRVQFDTARNLYLYAWHVYRFHMVAEQQAMSSLELALRTRLISASVIDAEGVYIRTLPPKKPGGPLREVRTQAKLSLLLSLAAEKGVLQNEWIKNRSAWAARLAYRRQREESSRRMTELGITELAIPHDPPRATEAELNFDWIGHLTKTMPGVRNIHAHGSSMLHSTVLWTFEVVHELIEQAFAGPR